MSTKPENSFRAGIHRHLTHKLHHEKMANPYSSGTADDWYSGTKADLWIEYKFLPRLPLRAIVAPMKLLTPLQATWMNERHEEKRTVAVVIGCPDGGVVLQNKEWQCELTAEEYKRRLLSRKDIASWIEQVTME